VGGGGGGRGGGNKKREKNQGGAGFGGRTPYTGLGRDWPNPAFYVGPAPTEKNVTKNGAETPPTTTAREKAEGFGKGQA